jgi:hypothetical protein
MARLEAERVEELRNRIVRFEKAVEYLKKDKVAISGLKDFENYLGILLGEMKPQANLNSLEYINMDVKFTDVGYATMMIISDERIYIDCEEQEIFFNLSPEKHTKEVLVLMLLGRTIECVRDKKGKDWKIYVPNLGKLMIVLEDKELLEFVRNIKDEIKLLEQLGFFMK